MSIVIDSTPAQLDTFRDWRKSRTENVVSCRDWSPEADLLKDYQAWCAANGEEPMQDEAFAAELNGNKIRRNVMLVPRGEAEPEEETCRALRLVNIRGMAA